MNRELVFVAGFEASRIKLRIAFTPANFGETWRIVQVENADGDWWPFDREKPADRQRLKSLVKTWLDTYGWDAFEQMDLDEERAKAERLAEGPDPDDAREAAMELHAAELMRAIHRNGNALLQPVAVGCAGL